MQSIVAKRNAGGSEIGFTFYLRFGLLAARFGNGTALGRFIDDAGASPVVSDASWHHVAITIDRDDPAGAVMYLDGESVLTYDPTGVTGSVIATNTPLRIGGDSAPGWEYQRFEGAIDELMLFRRALTVDEIAGIHDAGPDGVFLDASYGAGDDDDDDSGDDDDSAEEIDGGGNSDCSVADGGAPTAAWLLLGIPVIARRRRR